MVLLFKMHDHLSNICKYFFTKTFNLVVTLKPSVPPYLCRVILQNIFGIIVVFGLQPA